MHQVVYDNKYINIVMELVEGRPLSELLARGAIDKAKEYHPIDEELCKIIMYQCTVALVYLHSKKVAHRDLKLDNIMICGFDVVSPESNDSQKCRIKLIDFGLSKYKRRDHKMTSDCGTLDYMSPEVLMRKDYDEGCDMWSLGVVAFFLLAGYPPFLADKEALLKKKIQQIDYDFNEADWANVSPECKDWIERLLTHAEKRMTAKDALTHEWLSSEQSKTISKKSIKIL